MTEETEAVEVVETEAVTTADEAMSVSDMFADSKDEASEVVETAEATTDDDQGDTTETVEAKAEAETEEAETPSAADTGHLAGMLAERDKRQKAERRVAELEAAVEPESRIDPIEDPEGYRDSIEAKANASELRTKITLSQSMMTELDPDYTRLEGVFKGLIADEEGHITDENLVRQFQQSDNPAKFARDHAKEHESIAAMKDPAYKVNLEAEIRAKVLAEIAEKAKQGISVTDVPNLTGAPAAGTNSQKVVPEATIEGMFP
jgi:hypothetical protein